MIDTLLISAKFEKSPGGCECRFVKINDETAAKIYESEAQRDCAYNQQTLAAEHGLGPETYGTFAIPEGFGYITEVVEVVPQKHDGNYGYVQLDDVDYGEQISDLSYALKEIGIHEKTINDIYFANIGFKNGKVVCIDFGRSH